MPAYLEAELREAARAIASTLRKCEKAIQKLREDSAPYVLTARGIAAYRIALGCIWRELGETPQPNAAETGYADEERRQALEALRSAAKRVESVLPKLASGTPQHTLAVRRLRAFAIAQALILRG